MEFHSKLVVFKDGSFLENHKKACMLPGRLSKDFEFLTSVSLHHKLLLQL
ncbi:MAG: hypothetical protein ACI8SN_002632, partial [Algoriphagus sp.]